MTAASAAQSVVLLWLSMRANSGDDVEQEKGIRKACKESSKWVGWNASIVGMCARLKLPE